MPKPVRGRAGREQRREEMLTRYGADLAQMLLRQARIAPEARVMHLGFPGASLVAEAIAHMLTTGELLVVVHSYDEMEETRAALAGMANVEVINDVEDLDPDEQRFDVATCIVPYYLGRDGVEKFLTDGLDLLSSEATLYLAGDKQQGFERQLEFLALQGSRVTPLAQQGHYRVVSATKPGRGGRLTPRELGS